MLSNHLSINLPKASINVTWGIFFWKEMVYEIFISSYKQGVALQVLNISNLFLP